MRTQGKITHWNDEKGYGFITPESGAKQVFVHVRAFGNREARPAVGQMVSFSLSTDKQGRPCARDVTRDGEPAAASRPRSRKKRPRQSGARAVLIVLVAVLAAVGYYYRSVSVKAVPSNPVPASVRSIPQSSPKFHCDGRTHCSEMTSCEEATYFVRHCPNTKMDGDRDGVPCESQWCGR